MPYTTKQQQAILSALSRRRQELFSAGELAEELRAGGFPVGLATIYRQLEKLERSGQIHKVNTEEGALYQYCDRDGGRHRDCFLLRCESCGRIQHLDCSHLGSLYTHLEQEHHFVIDPRRTLFSGLCSTCAEKEASHGEQ